MERSLQIKILPDNNHVPVSAAGLYHEEISPTHIWGSPHNLAQQHQILAANEIEAPHGQITVLPTCDVSFQRIAQYQRSWKRE